MILTLFLVLLSICLLCVILGYFTDDEPYLTVGLFFLFLLSSLVILPGNLEYETGATIATVGGTSTITYNHTAWDDSMSHRVGWVLSVASAFGFALSLYNIRKNRKGD